MIRLVVISGLLLVGVLAGPLHAEEVAGDGAGDGVVDRLLSLDRDGDGRLSPSELGALGLFRRLDADGDDLVTRAEIARYFGTASPVAESERDEAVAAHANLRYAEVAGVDANLLSLDLHVPRGVKRAPLLVMIHGGGWRNGDKASAGMTRDKVPHFTKAGWAYASVNYRLSPAVRHPVHVQDVAKAIAWLHDHMAEYGGDPERIFLMGHSAGAHLAALVATDHRRLGAEGKTLAILDGVVLLDGAGYDLGRLADLRGSAGIGRLYETAFGSDPVAWRDASPMTHVAPDKGIPPFLVFHAGRRPASKVLSEALAAKLVAAGVPARTVHAADKDHAGINHCIGMTSDPYTEAVMSFLAHPRGAGSSQATAGTPTDR